MSIQGSYDWLMNSNGRDVSGHKEGVQEVSQQIMANIKFVATQVMEPGEDGLTFKTQQLESEEEHNARLAKERAATGKTLFEQLSENKDKAKADYDAITKQIFAPPKALDEDDIAFLEGVARHEKQKEQKKAEQEAQELAAFAAARANQVKAATPATVVSRMELARPPVEKKAFPEVKLKVKRKDKGDAKGHEKKKVKKEKEGKEKVEGGNAGPAPGLGLVAYGSDDEEGGEDASKEGGD